MLCKRFFRLRLPSSDFKVEAGSKAIGKKWVTHNLQLSSGQDYRDD